MEILLLFYNEFQYENWYKYFHDLLWNKMLIDRDKIFLIYDIIFTNFKYFNIFAIYQTILKKGI